MTSLTLFSGFSQHSSQSFGQAEDRQGMRLPSASTGQHMDGDLGPAPHGTPPQSPGQVTDWRQWPGAHPAAADNASATGAESASGTPLPEAACPATPPDAWQDDMHVCTDRGNNLTRVYRPGHDVLAFETRTDVVRSAKDGADGPYEGTFTYCEYPNSSEFGTAKWRTTDSRLRWIHGGGTGLADPLAPEQGWKPTLGCTRAQNVDVETLCSISEQWKQDNPGKDIHYHRR